MFERYTEKARRTIFFARYEASQMGSPYIESEHLLLGLLRESAAVSRHLKLDRLQLAGKLRSSSTIKEKIGTSVDLPLANPTKRILAYAAEEAEEMSHQHIGTEHLLLGILREEECTAAKVLRGMNAPALDEVREAVKVSDAADAGKPGRLAGPSAPLMGSMRLVDEQTGQEFPSPIPSFRGAPRIGDAVLVKLQDGTLQKYRVTDVQWSFEEGAREDGFKAAEVKLLIRRKDPDKSRRSP